MKTLTLPIEEKLLKQTLKKYGVTKAAVFGSFARGDARPDSDLDLLVDFQDGVSLFDHSELIDELERLTKRKVDVVANGGHLGQRFRDEIRPDLSHLEL